MRTSCGRLRQRLGAFVDGALSGAEMLRVSEHVASCHECREQIAAIRGLGGLLRDASAQTPIPADLAGLADGVTSRIRAEQAQSWTATMKRAVEDWHWVVVCVGSVAAAFVSTMLVSALLLFGPAPERDDSLAALLNNLSSPAGMLFAYATPVGSDQSQLMLVANDTNAVFAPGLVGVVPAQFAAPTEMDLVQELANLLGRQGQLIDVQSMSDEDRRYAEALIAVISKLRSGEPRDAVGPVTVHSLWLAVNTQVTAKGV
jgi:Putative zinc-finger